MKKLGKSLLVVTLVFCAVWLGMRLADKQRLHNDLIRLHVVADSDSEEDQKVKLQVRDAVIATLHENMCAAADAEQAREYISAHLPEIESAANEALAAAGSTDTASVTLRYEAFPTREYETFSLPAGVYESLRVEIGDAEGKNWWCVVFPTLCIPAASEDYRDTAASAGFPQSLSDTLAGEENYQIDFFFLECIGKIENFLFNAF